jgi:hypothetical protein
LSKVIVKKKKKKKKEKEKKISVDSSVPALQVRGKVDGQKVLGDDDVGEDAHALVGGGDQLGAEEGPHVVLLVPAGPGADELHQVLLVGPPLHLLDELLQSGDHVARSGALQAAHSQLRDLAVAREGFLQAAARVHAVDGRLEEPQPRLARQRGHHRHVVPLAPGGELRAVREEHGAVHEDHVAHVHA